MPNWKKVIVSGSDAELSNLSVTGNVTSSIVSASIYYGNGSNLTGIEGITTSSLLTTASVNLNTITFTKGDASTFDITVDTGSVAAFPYTGNAEITGSLIVSSSTTGNELQIGDNKLIVSSSGDVGIGITTPTRTLDVSGQTRFGQNLGSNDGGWDHVFTANDGNGLTLFKESYASSNDRLVVLANQDNEGSVQILNGSGGLSFLLKSSGDSYINNGNNFGIGTTTPSTKLEVNGTISGSGLDIAGTADINGNTTITNGTLNVTSGTGNGNYLNLDTVSTNYSTAIVFKETGTVQWAMGNVGPGDSFRISNSTTTLSSAGGAIEIIENRNVGIGTLLPSTKLHVAGTISGSGLDIAGTADINGNTTITGSLDIDTGAASFGFSNYNLTYGSSLNISANNGGYIQIKPAANLSLWSNGSQALSIAMSNATGNSQIQWQQFNRAQVNIAASTEVPTIKYTGANKTWQTGNITTQRYFDITGNTASFAGASTITDAYGLYVEETLAGTNATITNNYAIGAEGAISASTYYGDGSNLTGIDIPSTASLLTTASVSLNTITFTKGDASTFNITVDTGSVAAFPYTGSAEITGSLGITGSLNIYKSGSTVFNIEGSQGTLFTVTDELSGSLFSVNDISGIPILEVFSDDTVKLGTYNAEAIIVSGSTATASGSFSGSFQGDGVNLTNISGSSLYSNVRTYKLEMGASSTTVITTGQKGLKTVPYLGTIVGWKLISDVSTSTVIDIWKRNNAIPSIADSITAGAKPTLTTSQLATSTTLTGWTTSVSPDDVFTINVDSNDSATYLALELDILLT